MNAIAVANTSESEWMASLIMAVELPMMPAMSLIAESATFPPTPTAATCFVTAVLSMLVCRDESDCVACVMMNLLVANVSLLFGGRFQLGEKKTRLRVSYCPAGVRASAAKYGPAPWRCATA